MLSRLCEPQQNPSKSNPPSTTLLLVTTATTTTRLWQVRAREANSNQSLQLRLSSKARDSERALAMLLIQVRLSLPLFRGAAVGPALADMTRSWPQPTNHGLRSSAYRPPPGRLRLSIACLTFFASPTLLARSRPKNLGEVSAQDHTVQVLTKTLTSSNVSPPSSRISLLSKRRRLTTRVLWCSSRTCSSTVLPAPAKPRRSSLCANNCSARSCTARACSN